MAQSSLPEGWAHHEYPVGTPQKYRIDGPSGYHVYAIKLDPKQRGYRYQLWCKGKRLGETQDDLIGAIDQWETNAAKE